MYIFSTMGYVQGAQANISKSELPKKPKIWFNWINPKVLHTSHERDCRSFFKKYREYNKRQHEDARKGKNVLRHTDFFKPTLIICITDGSPNDEQETKQAIASISWTLKNLVAEDISWQPNPQALRQLGIQFVQVGSDEDAPEFLRRLDEDLALKSYVDWYTNETVEIPDIVDTFNFRDVSEKIKKIRKETTKKTAIRLVDGSDLLKILMGALSETIDEQNELR